MPVEHSTDSINLRHPKGATAEILLYGATVVSWKASLPSGNLTEQLFVSSKAFLDGTKPVRGGIPIVFPCFGAPVHPDHSKLSQHGFARSEIWKFDSVVMDNEAGVSVRFTLEPTNNERIKSIYSKPFHLCYVVTLAEHQLSTDLHVKNTSSSTSFDFQALLHTYIGAPADEVEITPLQGLNYYDKTETNEEARATPKVETRPIVEVKCFTDSVYENAPLEYLVRWPEGGLDIKAKQFKDVVVWNPQEGGHKIGDMENAGWKRFVCVEPGYVRGFVNLGPQQTWVGQQLLSIPQA